MPHASAAVAACICALGSLGCICMCLHPSSPHAAETRAEMKRTEAKLFDVLKSIDEDMDKKIAANQEAKKGVPCADASYPTIAPAGPAIQSPAKGSQSLYPTVQNAVGAMTTPTSQVSVHACACFSGVCRFACLWGLTVAWEQECAQ